MTSTQRVTNPCLTILLLKPEFSEKLDQYRCYSCPGSLSRKDSSNNAIEYAE